MRRPYLVFRSRGHDDWLRYMLESRRLTAARLPLRIVRGQYWLRWARTRVAAPREGEASRSFRRDAEVTA